MFVLCRTSVLLAFIQVSTRRDLILVTQKIVQDQIKTRKVKTPKRKAKKKKKLSFDWIQLTFVRTNWERNAKKRKTEMADPPPFFLDAGSRPLPRSNTPFFHFCSCFFASNVVLLRAFIFFYRLKCTALLRCYRPCSLRRVFFLFFYYSIFPNFISEGRKGESHKIEIPVWQHATRAHGNGRTLSPCGGACGGVHKPVDVCVHGTRR